MFTGLIQALGEVSAIDPRPQATRLAITPRAWTHAPVYGESIAVSGVCLTLAEAPGATLAFDVIPQTLRLTTFGRLRPGSLVNLERSLAAGDLLGGHTVQGHVEGLGTIERVASAPEYRLTIAAPPDLMPCIVPRGSIAIDGVSLTIAATDPARRTFDVALIPTTLERTTLSQLRPGDQINLETDILARTVVNFLRHYR